ncbi:MAG: hydroxyacylglutathione hydrolase [Alphaproteobacteria bacterium]|nr:hydroxyacylglutathione hydrolase [Alphaproteobacteria bacterium]
MALILDVFQPFSDNYGFLLHDQASGATATVDAGEAEPIAERARQKGWRLTDILITHHHSDHTAGAAALKSEFGARITGPTAEADKIGGVDNKVSNGDHVMVGDSRLDIIGVPGHTLGHIAYFDEKGLHLFCGDALFSLGCGRMFEGEPKSMWAGLERLRALPDDTKIYCGHEYTLANARFALSIDPDNAALQARAAEAGVLLATGGQTIPAVLGLEKAANPFLRADDPGLMARMGLAGAAPHEVFAALRRAKDSFKG